MAKTREELMRMAKRTYQTVNEVRLQSLSELEVSNLRAIWAQRFNDEGYSLRSRQELLAMCIVDDDGKRLFGSTQADLDDIGSLDAKVTAPLYEACVKLCGLDADNDEVDKAEKK